MTHTSLLSRMKKYLKDMNKNVLLHDDAFVDMSSQFYTLIPQTFGVKQPPRINSYKIYADNYELLEFMKNMHELCSRSVNQFGAVALHTNNTSLLLASLKTRSQCARLLKNEP